MPGLAIADFLEGLLEYASVESDPCRGQALVMVALRLLAASPDVSKDALNTDTSKFAEERTLVDRMRAGDQQAFGAFFNAHAQRLAGFAARRCALDAAALEDVVQQTMINAMKNLSTFRGESSLFTWLCQICRNILADIRRKAARQPRVDSLDLISEDRPGSTPIQLIDYRDPLEASNADSVRGAIRRTVNRLPPRYVRVLELKYGDDLGVDEIAFTLGLTEVAVQSLLARARRAFKEIWAEFEEGSPGQSQMLSDAEGS